MHFSLLGLNDVIYSERECVRCSLCWIRGVAIDKLSLSVVQKGNVMRKNRHTYLQES